MLFVTIAFCDRSVGYGPVIGSAAARNWQQKPHCLWKRHITVAGEVMVDAGSAFTVTAFRPLALQPVLLVTITESVTRPDVPVVYVMLFVVLPAVIVPSTDAP